MDQKLLQDEKLQRKIKEAISWGGPFETDTDIDDFLERDLKKD